VQVARAVDETRMAGHKRLGFARWHTSAVPPRARRASQPWSEIQPL